MQTIHCARCGMTAVRTRYRNLMMGGSVTGRTCCLEP